MHVVPVGEGVNAFADALRVDVTLADQTLSRLYHSFDPVQVELHGGGEVLVLLYGSFNGFHCGGQFYVSEGRLLQNKHEISTYIRYADVFPLFHEHCCEFFYLHVCFTIIVFSSDSDYLYTIHSGQANERLC